MFPQPFEYTRANTVEDAVAKALAADDPQFVAGGHSLLPMMKLRMAAPELLIDIRGISELRGAMIDGETVRIGALTRHADLIRDAELNDAVPIFAMAGEQIADRQVRNRGTIGGSLVNADPSADWPAVLMMLDAVCVVFGPDAPRRVAIGDFIEGMMSVALEPAELLTAIEFAKPAEGSRYHYEKFRHPASGYAVAGVAVRLVQDDAGVVTDAAIGVTGCAESAFRADVAAEMLIGQALTSERVSAAAERAFQDVELLSDGFADTAYRRQLGEVLLARAVSGAAK